MLGPPVVGANPGDLDPTFGTNGKVTSSVAGGVAALVVQPDRKLVAASTTYHSDGRSDVTLTRYEGDGTLDPTFGMGGTVTQPTDASAAALVLQPDGKLVVAGEALVGSTVEFILARYEADGTLDATFGSGGTVTGPTNASAAALVLQPDGKLVAAGVGADSQGRTGFTLARYDADGTLDATFGVGGTVTTPISVNDRMVPAYANALVLQPDGKLVAAGTTSGRLTGALGFVLVRYDADGEVDQTFGIGGTVQTLIRVDNYTNFSYATALVLQPDGNLVAAGGTENRNAGLALVRYRPDGTHSALPSSSSRTGSSWRREASTTNPSRSSPSRASNLTGA